MKHSKIASFVVVSALSMLALPGCMAEMAGSEEEAQNVEQGISDHQTDKGITDSKGATPVTDKGSIEVRDMGQEGALQETADQEDTLQEEAFEETADQEESVGKGSQALEWIGGGYGLGVGGLGCGGGYGGYAYGYGGGCGCGGGGYAYGYGVGYGGGCGGCGGCGGFGGFGGYGYGLGIGRLGGLGW